MSKIASLENFAHVLITHAKDAIVALHGPEIAKKALPELGQLLKGKIDSVLLAGIAKL